VSIGTGTAVQSGAKVTVEVSESSNTGNVSYDISARTKVVTLSGNGTSTSTTFTLRTTAGNENGGDIISRVSLFNPQGGVLGAPNFRDDIRLTVNPPRGEGGGDDFESCVGIECEYSPILIDTMGDGFNLTNQLGGVRFDLNANGFPELISWTAVDTDDAFLVLDRNSNGVIDNGAEMFGNYTPQPPTDKRNGFAALAEYDKAANGGNGDGRINSQDAIFAVLRLWTDKNHNGFSEPDELHRLPALGVASIDLDYKEKRRRDEHGNWFRYQAKVYDEHGAQVGRWACDVFFVAQ
jgi:hypothetical protein